MLSFHSLALVPLKEPVQGKRDPASPPHPENHGSFRYSSRDVVSVAGWVQRPRAEAHLCLSLLCGLRQDTEPL